MKTLLFAVALAALSACQAHARCFPPQVVLFQLAETYGEQLVYEETRDVEGETILYQVWANAENGSWTFTGSNGFIICVLGAGHEYAGQTVSDFLDGTLDPQGTAL